MRMRDSEGEYRLEEGKYLVFFVAAGLIGAGVYGYARTPFMGYILWGMGVLFLLAPFKSMTALDKTRGVLLVGRTHIFGSRVREYAVQDIKHFAVESGRGSITVSVSLMHAGTGFIADIPLYTTGRARTKLGPFTHVQTSFPALPHFQQLATYCGKELIMMNAATAIKQIVGAIRER